MMNKFYLYALVFFFFSGCSEGDIIETEVNFEASLENCANLTDQAYVFYKIEDTGNKSLSVSFTSTTFEISPNVDDISTDESTTVTLNSTDNLLIFREYESAISGPDYFCNSVPPSGISIIDELISTEGTVNISYEALEATSNTQERYTRTVTVENATLQGDDIAIRKEYILLGSDTIEADISIDFTGDIQSCTEDPIDTFTLYKINSDLDRAITINFTNNIFDILPLADDISEDDPITISFDEADNLLTYTEFDTSFETEQTEDYFCNGSLPSSVTISKELTASSGILEISYTDLETEEDEETGETTQTSVRTYTVKDLIIEGTGTPVVIESLVLDTEQITIE
ncbi:hypothetical protein [Aquimarina pacifica]|uniref:hypothetical protein n=1 Tax=Aquimarina pacifica TaxID=1296415 RepID=UPI0004B36BDD|nr:hypothetical protein [Aquimarina pacifica]